MIRDDETSRVQSEIDANLKRAYQDVLNQDLPDRFTNLLAQLREQGSANGTEEDKNDKK